MDLTKIPTKKLEQLIKRIQTTRRKFPSSTNRWWFWFRVQQRAHEEMGGRYQRFYQYKKPKGVKNVSIQERLTDQKTDNN